MISAENGKAFFELAESDGRLKKKYPYGAKDLKTKHVYDVDRHDFCETQFFTNQKRNLKPFKPQNYQELKKEFWESLRLLDKKNNENLKYIMREGAKRVQEVDVPQTSLKIHVTG